MSTILFKLTLRLAEVAAFGCVTPAFASLLTNPHLSAVDANLGAVSPLITQVNVGTHVAYELSTGAYATSPFVSSLEFDFTPKASEPFLMFNFSQASSGPDPSGSSSSMFLDAFVVSIFDKTTSRSHVLLGYDQFSLRGDPYGTAPDTLVIGPAWPYTIDFQYNLHADLQPLVGHDLTLIFDIINADDGWSTTYLVESAPQLNYLTIPEPTAGPLLLLPLAVISWWIKRKQ